MQQHRATTKLHRNHTASPPSNFAGDQHGLYTLLLATLVDHNGWCLQCVYSEVHNVTEQQSAHTAHTQVPSSATCSMYCTTNWHVKSLWQYRCTIKV